MKKEITRHNYPESEKIYVPGKLHDIRVAMRKVNLTDTVNIVDGERVVRHNDPVYIYDTSGVYTDPSVEIDLEKGLAGVLGYRPWRRGETSRHHIGVRPYAPSRQKPR